MGVILTHVVLRLADGQRRVRAEEPTSTTHSQTLMSMLHPVNNLWLLSIDVSPAPVLHTHSVLYLFFNVFIFLRPPGLSERPSGLGLVVLIYDGLSSVRAGCVQGCSSVCAELQLRVQGCSSVCAGSPRGDSWLSISDTLFLLNEATLRIRLAGHTARVGLE